MPEQTQISHSAVAAAPNDYTLADNVEFRLVAVNANFTDNGAGSDWLPAVVLLSDSDHVIARALLPDVKVPAGGDAEVSFFPHVKPGGGAAAAAAFKYLHVVAGGGTNPQSPATIVTFDTNDPANYVQTDATHWTIPAVPQNLQTLLIPSATITTNGGVVGILQNNGGFGVNNTLGTGVVTDGMPAHWFLQEVFELAPTWHAAITGTDTHFWGIHAWFFYVG